MENDQLLISDKNVDRQLGTYLVLQKLVTLSLHSHRRDHYCIYDLHLLCVGDIIFANSTVTLKLGSKIELPLNVDKRIIKNLRLFCKPPKEANDFVFCRLHRRLLR
jgi:hypothetical protein